MEFRPPTAPNVAEPLMLVIIICVQDLTWFRYTPNLMEVELIRSRRCVPDYANTLLVYREQCPQGVELDSI